MSALRADAPIPSWHAWRERAACHDLDTTLFFPPGDGADSQEQIEQAKAVCAACPVRSECLSFAMQTRQEAGVWGGLTEEERRRLRRRLARERRKAS